MQLVNISREDVKKMAKGLTSLFRILTIGFGKVETYQIHRAILVIGDTGCGKSTLLSALHHGSDSLCMTLRPLTDEDLCKKNKNRRAGGRDRPAAKQLMIKVIEYKEEIIERAFKIGHKK